MTKLEADVLKAAKKWRQEREWYYTDPGVHCGNYGRAGDILAVAVTRLEAPRAKKGKK